MAEAPRDRANDPSRIPDDLSNLDFLASSGFTPEEQAGVSSRAGKPVPTLTWGPNRFDTVPCRDCSGSLRVHDETCIRHPRRNAITAVEDPKAQDANFKNLYTEEQKND
jgi:hypothetical protein